MYIQEVWSVTTRIEGEIDTTLHTSESDAIGLAVDNLLAPAYDYEGPLTIEAINAFMIEQKADDGYDELVITKHELKL